MSCWLFSGKKLCILLGDITQARVDAVVNAANARLAGGGGVDGAIHRAAGPRLDQACAELIRNIQTVPTGSAVATPGFNMPARHILHAVGPIWRGGHTGEAMLLESTYASCLRLANELGLKHIAFPAISCGAYGYPVELAAPIALGTIRSGLQNGLVDTVSFYLFGANSYEIWLEAAEEVFGPKHAES